MSGEVKVSLVVQMDPVGRYRNRMSSDALAGTDIDSYARELARYFATNLERFADPRGADVFLQVVVDRDGERGSHEYRSGHYVKDDGAATPQGTAP